MTYLIRRRSLQVIYRRLVSETAALAVYEDKDPYTAVCFALSDRSVTDIREFTMDRTPVGFDVHFKFDGLASHDIITLNVSIEDPRTEAETVDTAGWDTDGF